MSDSIGDIQRQRNEDDLMEAARALLMMPSMRATDPVFAHVRRHAEALREWFAREAGWVLHVERDGARLYKRPADLSDSTRGLPNFNRQRYVLFSLACAVLERADAQITLRILGDKILQSAAELSFDFSLSSPSERRDLIAVCKMLLSLGVLVRIAGDEDAFEGSSSVQGDALYDVHRRALAGVLAAVRGPSSWPRDRAPSTLDARLVGLVAEHTPESEEGRRTAIRHHLARRLLDDPVVYVDSLEPEVRAYFSNQRGAMTTRLAAFLGMLPEHRAEGSALVDAQGGVTDVPMPHEGTDAHVTLLVAEHLAALLRRDGLTALLAVREVASYIERVAPQYGRYWRKSARLPGAEHELAQIALERLEKLRLIVRDRDDVRPLAAVARYAVGAADVGGAKAP